MNHLTPASYDAFSSDYDRFVNWNNRLAFELPFLTAQLSQLGQPGEVRVLDAACGTGMHAIALSQRGFRLSGADLSQGMVDRARENAAAAAQQVEFLRAGFGDLAHYFPPASFDAILCLGNSLPHLLSVADLSLALHDFSTVLRPGGRMILQNRNFDAVMSSRDRWMEPQSHLEGGEERVFLRLYDYLPGGLIDFHIVTLRREPGGKWLQQISTTRLFPLLHDILIERLVAAGFQNISVYGSLDGSSLDPAASGNLVVTALKA
jgi:glycine/sarcosine N-methyltransferase